MTGGKRAAERAGNGRGAEAEGTPYYYGARKGQAGGGGRREGRLRGRRAPRREGETRGPREKDGRRPAKKRPRGKREFPSRRSHFFSSKKNVKRPRKTKALLGTTYHAGNHKNGKLRATEEKYLTHTRNEKIQKNVKTPVNTAKKHPELPHSGIRDASC